MRAGDSAPKKFVYLVDFSYDTVEQRIGRVLLSSPINCAAKTAQQHSPRNLSRNVYLKY